LDNVDLTVHAGEIFGIVGPNGCGKSTLVRVPATLLIPEEGVALHPSGPYSSAEPS
jgi:ABC-2 type transport system ATP-binding protein